MNLFRRNEFAPAAAGNLVATILVAAATCSTSPVWANVVPSPTINTFALYAERSVRLGANNVVKGGHVGIAAAGPTRLVDRI
jgi:hypothetical protein